MGGLDAKVKDEDISEYFQSLGVDVVMPKVIMLDKRSRCFGFVHFKCESDVDKVMAMGQHHIFGKQVSRGEGNEARLSEAKRNQTKPNQTKPNETKTK